MTDRLLNALAVMAGVAEETRFEAREEAGGVRTFVYSKIEIEIPMSGNAFVRERLQIAPKSSDQK